MELTIVSSCSFEIELAQVKVKQADYKRIQISKLSLKAKYACLDLISDPNSTYEDRMERLHGLQGEDKLI